MKTIVNFFSVGPMKYDDVDINVHFTASFVKASVVTLYLPRSQSPEYKSYPVSDSESDQ